MVKKPQHRIAKKPATPPPAADNWVQGGGIDPEIQSPALAQDAAAPAPAETPPAAETAKGKAYPHRISYDTDKGQYRRLKRASFEEERPVTEIVREAVEEWLKARNY